MKLLTVLLILACAGCGKKEQGKASGVRGVIQTIVINSGHNWEFDGFHCSEAPESTEQNRVFSCPDSTQPKLDMSALATNPAPAKPSEGKKPSVKEQSGSGQFVEQFQVQPTRTVIVQPAPKDVRKDCKEGNTNADTQSGIYEKCVGGKWTRIEAAEPLQIPGEFHGDICVGESCSKEPAKGKCRESSGVIICEAPLEVGPAVKGWAYQVFPDPQQLGEWIERNCEANLDDGFRDAIKNGKLHTARIRCSEGK